MSSAHIWDKDTIDDTTLYARWSPNTYYVAFDKNGGDSGTMSNQTFTYDVAQNLRTNAYGRTGYRFAKWQNSSGTTFFENMESVTNLTATHNATVTLYAVWNANSYTINYVLNNGGTRDSTSATYDVASQVTSPTRTGYKFTGWKVTSGLNTSTAYYGTSSSDVSTRITGSNQSCVNSTNENDPLWFKNITATHQGNVTLSANWSINQYTATFDGNGGTPAMTTKT